VCVRDHQHYRTGQKRREIGTENDIKLDSWKCGWL